MTQAISQDSAAPAPSDRAAASKQAVSRNSKADLLPHNTWQGRDINFMRSNEHGRERSGMWNTNGLSGAALKFVGGDEKAAKCEVALGAVLHLGVRWP